MHDQGNASGDKLVIRPLATKDHAELLRLNAENQPAVCGMSATDLDQLVEFDGYHLVAADEQGAILGYLLSFPRESGYDDTEMQWHRQHLREPFYYICQVVVAREHRRRKIGRVFYQSLIEVARQQGVRVLCSDVNTAPANRESFAFHRHFDFIRIGEGLSSDGTPVAYLASWF